MAAPQRLPAVLFDLDDTLVPWQTVPHWQWAWRPNGPLVPERHALAAIKRSLKSWDRRRWQGVVGALPSVGPADHRQFLTATLTEVAGHSLPPTELEAVLDRFQRPLGDLERFPDAAPCLAELLGRGHPVGVVTDLPTETARSLMKRSGLDDRLLILAAEGGEVPLLPAVPAFRAAARRMGRKPSEILFVGDLYWSDARAAHRVGMESVLIDRRDIWPRVSGERRSSLEGLLSLSAFLPKPASSHAEPGAGLTPS